MYLHSKFYCLLLTFHSFGNIVFGAVITNRTIEKGDDCGYGDAHIVAGDAGLLCVLSAVPIVLHYFYTYYSIRGILASLVGDRASQQAFGISGTMLTIIF